MEATTSRNRLLVLLIAIATAAALAISLTALPTQADAAGYQMGTPASQVKSKYKTSKSKVVGTWKLVGSNLAYEKLVLKNYKKKGITNKLIFKRNGTAIEKAYKKSKVEYKWVAVSKKAGYLIGKNRVIAKFSVQGKNLTVRNYFLKRKYTKV